MALITEKDRAELLSAERAVIGSMLIDDGIVREVLAFVSADDFLLPANRAIFQAARALYRDGEPVDAVTVRGRCGREYADYMVQLMELTPTSANWRAYAEYMKEQTALHRIQELSGAVARAETLDECRSLCASMGQLLAGGRTLETWTMKELLDDFYAAQDPDSPEPDYVSFGIAELDEGLFARLGDVAIIGGYPSDGKTALALMMAYHMARKYRVGFFSLETNREKLRDRLVSSAAQIDFGAIKRRRLDESDWAALAAKGADFAGRGLTVIPAAGMTPSAIISTSEARGFDIVFIDYVQLVTPEIDRRAPRSEQMADVSRILHTFAQKNGVMVVELAQLTRQDKSSGWRAPNMHDLKESGQFEQDADLIFLLYRPNPKDEIKDQKTFRHLNIVKNKEGRCGDAYLYFDGAKQTFSVMQDDSGRAVMREMVAAGKRARAANRAEPCQTTFWDGSDWTELPDDPDNPFGEEAETT